MRISVSVAIALLAASQVIHCHTVHDDEGGKEEHKHADTAQMARKLNEDAIWSKYGKDLNIDIECV